MRWTTVLAALAALAGCGDAADPPIAKICPPGDPMSVLVITRQTVWDHPSNPVAADAIRAMALARGWRIEVAGDPIVVTEDQLTRTDVIVFSLTSGVILDDEQHALLERFFRSAGGFAGTHSASFTEGDWPFYGKLVPVSFKAHPPVFEGHLTIEDSHDPIVAGLPDPWIRSDELYTFDGRPEDLGVHVLLALDESAVPDSYPQDMRVGYHPITWTHDLHGFRAFYTALGHTIESYREPLFLQMLEHGIAWAGADHHAARCGAGAPP